LNKTAAQEFHPDNHHHKRFVRRSLGLKGILPPGAMRSRRELLENSLERWYDLIPHPEQLRLVREDKRFKVVPAGRRSGKTERAKRFILKHGMKSPGETLFIAAPTRDQVKRIYWQDIKKMSFSNTHLKRPSETELKIYLPNGTTVQLIGLDKPERFEGTPWTGGIIDEIANVKEEAWAENIKPALDTFDPSAKGRRPWCWLIGVPEGLNHYFEMAEYAKNSGDEDWGYYHWISADILPPDIIAAAKRTMSARQYRQEYEASFETTSGRIYDDYGSANKTDRRLKQTDPIYWSHDFNFTPLSSCIDVRDGENLYLVDEIVLTSAVAKNAAVEFCEKFRRHKNRKVFLFGDPAGRVGEKHGHQSDYTVIKDYLMGENWSVIDCIKSKAPSIRDRQNSVRNMIATASGETRLFVNPKKAPWCHKGLSTVQVKDGSSFQEDQKNKYQHITTAIGYMIDVIWPSISNEITTQVIRL
jgi:hypothetical protein